VRREQCDEIGDGEAQHLAGAQGRCRQHVVAIGNALGGGLGRMPEYGLNSGQRCLPASKRKKLDLFL
jgi:hypothetical protein